MKTPSAGLFWKSAGLLALTAACILGFISYSSRRHRSESVAATRESLRREGFKTDLSDFNFSTTPDVRVRENALRVATPNQMSRPSAFDAPNLMEFVDNNSAVVVWKQDTVKAQSRSWDNDKVSWEEFHEELNENESALDSACAAILAGPIRFNLNASHGDAMLLPHLATLKNLVQTFGNRIILKLHDGDGKGAFTNLLAATRLVTAWEIEPVEISQMVRFGNTKIVFGETWQALQTNLWSEEQLARLQAEWESVDFFKGLPETAAFKRAADVAALERDERQSTERPPFGEFFKIALRFPNQLWSEMRYRSRQSHYSGTGIYETQKAMLLFYRDREVELREAVKATTWTQMQQSPGVTNQIIFQSKYNSPALSRMQTRQLALNVQAKGARFLSRAAEAEVERRILIAAIALERFRKTHTMYPAELSALIPDFMKIIPTDFVDGRPLRYKLLGDGKFLLYSIGMDGVDNGGKSAKRERPGPEEFRALAAALPKGDILWPLPASAAAATALRQKEQRAAELRNLDEEQRNSENEWTQSPLRLARVENILATKWTAEKDGSAKTRRILESIRNDAAIGTNKISLDEVLTPKQVITGNEPENLTFEFPVRYESLTNMAFFLLLDAETNAEVMFVPDSGARMQERLRATNGNCLLIWHTIFDPPGRHALQVEWGSERPGEYWGKGPAIPVVTTNLCQFNLASAHFDPQLGADFQARLVEFNGDYIAEMKSTNGILLKTITGATTNGIIKAHWDLADEQGHRLIDNEFQSFWTITLPDSGRTQKLKGP